MSRASAVFALPIVAAFALVACRAVIGIEPLEIDDASTASDGGKDGATDGGGPRDAASSTIDASACAAEGSNCPQCCHQTFGPAFDELPLILRDAGCICGGALCSDVANGCGDQTCADPPQPPAPPCGPCIDQTVVTKPLSPACNDGVTRCNADPSCTAATQCLAVCHP